MFFVGLEDVVDVLSHSLYMCFFSYLTTNRATMGSAGQQLFIFWNSGWMQGCVLVSWAWECNGGNWIVVVQSLIMRYFTNSSENRFSNIVGQTSLQICSTGRYSHRIMGSWHTMSSLEWCQELVILFPDVVMCYVVDLYALIMVIIEYGKERNWGNRTQTPVRYSYRAAEVLGIGAASWYIEPWWSSQLDLHGNYNCIG